MYLKYTVSGSMALQVKTVSKKQPTLTKSHRVESKVSLNTLSISSTFALYCCLIQSSQVDAVLGNSNENENIVTSRSSTLNGSLNSSTAQEAALATSQYSVQMSSPSISYWLEDAAPVGTTLVSTRLS